MAVRVADGGARRDPVAARGAERIEKGGVDGCPARVSHGRRIIDREYHPRMDRREFLESSTALAAGALIGRLPVQPPNRR